MACLTKISFMGDIMCEGPLLRAFLHKKGSAVFDTVFSRIEPLCRQSDYVIGNLETPFAGPNARYTTGLYSFNTPDEFAQAVQKCGVHLVTTANNHCLDRGLQGLERTLDVLDRIGLSHTGTFRARNEPKSPFIGEIGDMKIAVISCTSTTNYSRNHQAAEAGSLNLLLPIDYSKASSQGGARLKTAAVLAVRKLLGDALYIKFRRLLGLPYNKPSTDNDLPYDAVAPYLRAIQSQIDEAKKKADLVFVCPHMGGQFNALPGRFSEYIMDQLSQFGADAVIGTHPHIVQKFEIKPTNVPCAYSLGNVSMSMSTPYILKADLPDYSVMLHLYIEAKKIVKITYSLLKIQEDEHGQLVVLPLQEAYADATGAEKENLLRDAQFIAKRFSGKAEPLRSIPQELELCAFQ